MNVAPRIKLGSLTSTALAAASRVALPEEAQLLRPEVQQELLHELRRHAGDSLASLKEQLQSTLNRPPYFAVVEGMPTGPSPVVFVATSAALGVLVEPYRQTWSRLVREILPARDRIVGGHVLNTELHTDGTDWQQPNDLTCLLCVEPDQYGDGRSLLLEGAAFHESVRGTSAALATLLEQPLPWRIADELGGQLHHAPVFAGDTVRWLRYTIERALGEGTIAPRAEMAAALESASQAARNSPAVFDLMLRSGDLLVVSNTRCLHARTPISAPDSSNRLLLRTKVRLRESQPGA